MDGRSKRRRDKHQLPICTLSILGARLYIVNSLDLVLAVQKQSKALNFMALTAKMVGPVSNASPEARRLLEDCLDSETPGGRLVPEFFKAIHTYLAPGPFTDEMNRTSMKYVAGSLDKLGPSAQRISFFAWVRHEVTMASFEGAYGPDHIFRDPEIENLFW